MAQYEGVVTPEAVLLEFETAAVASRAAASCIDLLIRGAVAVAIALAGAGIGSFSGGLPDWVTVTVLTLVSAALILVYPVAFEASSGQTPGKAALGLRVVTTEGGHIGVRHATIRMAVGLFEVLSTFGLVASIVSLASARSQRAGDHAAGTMVLRERSAQKTPEAMRFVPPQGGEDYAASLDVSSLTADDYVAVRSLLTRYSTFNAHSRNRLADDLGGNIAVKLRVQPLPWMTAVDFLNCVAAAYQRRFTDPGR